MPSIKCIRYCPSPCDPVLGNIGEGVRCVDYEDKGWTEGLWGGEKEIGDSVNIQAGRGAPIIISKTTQNYKTAFDQ